MRGTWLLLSVLLSPVAGYAQPSLSPQPSKDALGAVVAEAAATATTSDPPVWMTYANRRIVELRATVFSRPPAIRAADAIQRLDRIADEAPAARVETSAYDRAVVIGLAGHPLLVVFQADMDALTGERLEQKAADAAQRLQVAFDEAVELRNPVRLATAGLVALTLTLVFVAGIWMLVRIDRTVGGHLGRRTERQLRRARAGHLILRLAGAPTLVRRSVDAFLTIVGLIASYVWLTAVLRQFPYTRAWGQTLSSGLLSLAGTAARSFVDALPGLAIVLLIALITRFAARLTTALFRAVEDGSVSIPGIYPETAQPTRRIVVTLLWLFALIVSYGYLPGSGSEAFKGVSVFVGLMVSLGSTGFMNQIMSGLMITYSRALKRNDFVRIGDTEGTVIHLGTLSTKVRTPRNEEITIPNTVVVSDATTNYSRPPDHGAVLAATSVTIGYDVPWRQVEALLLLAAERTAGVRPDPKPAVVQAGLDDFYVRYTLLVSVEQQPRRNRTLGVLHANIQDAFNEYGVQIMSPHYETDPAGRKVVPRDQWAAAPAGAVGRSASERGNAPDVASRLP